VVSPHTVSILAQECVSVLEGSDLPSFLSEIIAEEFEHHILFFVSWGLTPKTMNDFLLA
jgi:hypothetical protein